MTSITRSLNVDEVQTSVLEHMGSAPKRPGVLFREVQEDFKRSKSLYVDNLTIKRAMYRLVTAGKVVILADCTVALQ